MPQAHSHFRHRKPRRFGGHGGPQAEGQGHGRFRPRQGGFQRGGQPKQGGRNFGEFNDHSVFVNKAVVTEESAPYVPEHRFQDLAIDERLKRAIFEKGYRQPTPIQDHSIPHILRGADIVGIANTGTGKTGAFLIPLLHTLLQNPREQILIMVPTRELATQIADEFRGFTKNLRLFAAVCVGGVNINPQIQSLRRRPHVVIGTPGRLKDLLERRELNLSVFRTVVLDEADRMLDMGFIADMRKILALLPRPRHTLFFSATLSSEIERLIGEFLTNPVRIKVSTRETSASIEQDIVRVPRGGDKFRVLCDLLAQPGFGKVLVFGRTKHGIDKLSKKLVQHGIKSESIHGNKTQGKRQKALTLFKQDHVQVLCATDVAARGLDIAGVSHVINYDLPATREDYVHRIGRTGRAGKRGIALTFVEV